ncbi:cell envelope integrity TolA C-terminal domain-containing protein [Klebsiella pneumoniae]|uniref:cell envelope integrity TolA C-terminal domain-containing protein n=1 Tax=Klebsiella pneumoniae TaxID=573 RepID=UPI003D08F805
MQHKYGMPLLPKCTNPMRIKEKTCSIRIYLQPDGSVNSATAKEGDAKLCKAAISAITRAKIPAAPDNETYQRVKNAALDFRTIEMKFEVVIEEMPYCDLSVIRFFIAKVGLLQRH